MKNERNYYLDRKCLSVTLPNVYFLKTALELHWPSRISHGSYRQKFVSICLPFFPYSI